MSEVFNLPNSIWPNGIKVDDEGYAVFYPLGTNKIEVPTDSSSWPTGDKLISPFVYQNNKLVGFCDTKAMTVSGNTTITLPYTHIEADFTSIEEGKLTVNAPNATVKRFEWSVVVGGGNDDGGNGGDSAVLIRFEDMDLDTVKLIQSAHTITNNVLYDSTGKELGTFDTSKLVTGSAFISESDMIDTVSGQWALLYGQIGDVRSNSPLVSFDSDLSSLENGIQMFSLNWNIKSFKSNLSSLKQADLMFYYCQNLESFDADLNSLEYSGGMFKDCYRLKTFKGNLDSYGAWHELFPEWSPLTDNGGSPIETIHTSLKNCNYIYMNYDNLHSLTIDDLSYYPNENDNYLYGLCVPSSKLTSLNIPDRPFGIDNEQYVNELTFNGAILDVPSIKLIIKNLRQAPEGYGPNYEWDIPFCHITLGVGIPDTDEARAELASELGFNSWDAVNQHVYNLGHYLEWQFNGTATYGMRRTVEPSKIWAKLEEVILEENETRRKHYRYTSQDGTKFYNVRWNHQSNVKREGYEQFNSLEEAIEHFDIKPVERKR